MPALRRSNSSQIPGIWVYTYRKRVHKCTKPGNHTCTAILFALSPYLELLNMPTRGLINCSYSQGIHRNENQGSKTLRSPGMQLTSITLGDSGWKRSTHGVTQRTGRSQPSRTHLLRQNSRSRKIPSTPHCRQGSFQSVYCGLIKVFLKTPGKYKGSIIKVHRLFSHYI